jgi:hypothetical protein
VPEFDSRVEPPVLESFDGPADDLHVLLRHRLLRHASCFEGLRAIRKIILPDDQASVKSHELKELLIDGDAASRSMPAHYS